MQMAVVIFFLFAAQLAVIVPFRLHRAFKPEIRYQSSPDRRAGLPRLFAGLMSM
jgi:hypothetical protein